MLAGAEVPTLTGGFSQFHIDEDDDDEDPNN